MNHKLLLLAIGGAMVAGLPASAQVPFRIARPVNGATVRETVKIQIPRSALGDIKYLSLTVDGKFRAGVAVPDLALNGKPVKTETILSDASTVTLLWNTKAPVADPKNPQILEGVEDGTHSIKVIGYNASDRKVAEETLTLTVSNRGQLAMPAQGIPLSYGFSIGEQTRWKQKTDLEFRGERKSAPTGALNTGGFPGGGPMGGPPMGMGGPMGMRGPGGAPMGMGGGMGMGGMGMGGMGMGGMGMGGMMGGGALPDGPFSIPVQSVRASYERTVEDQLEPGVYFIRDRVKNGTIVGPNAAPMRLEDVYDFKSRYRSVRTRGQVKTHIVPSADKPGAYVALPIIDLGGQRRRIGSQWYTQAPILLEWATLDAPPMVNCTNTLETLEWQDGYKTARIKQTYKGTGTVPLYGGLGKMTNAKIDMVRTIWFAYGQGRVIRTETITDVQGDAPSSILSAMVPASGVGGGTMGGMMGGGMMGGPPMGMMGAGGGAGVDDMGAGPMMGGGMMGGMGGMQSQGAEAKAPAHFVSTTVVTYDPPVSARKKAAPTRRKR